MRPIDGDKLVEYINGKLWDECLEKEIISSEGIANEIKRNIFKMPTIGVAQVIHAKWVRKFDEDGECYYECSHCGLSGHYCEEDEAYDILTPFCEDCGAKMELELEDCKHDDPQTV